MLGVGSLLGFVPYSQRGGRGRGKRNRQSQYKVGHTQGEGLHGVLRKGCLFQAGEEVAGREQPKLPRVSDFWRRIKS